MKFQKSDLSESERSFKYIIEKPIFETSKKLKTFLSLFSLLSLHTKTPADVRAIALLKKIWSFGDAQQIHKTFCQS